MSEPRDVLITKIEGMLVISTELPELPACLSDSEAEIVKAALAGCSNVEIAKQRGTSTKTVANQLYAIYRKLGISARHELALVL